MFVSNNKKTFNKHKELASNDKEIINIGEKTVIDSIQTIFNKSNFDKETVTNIYNNNIVLEVNVDNNEINSKDTWDHENKNNN